MNLDRMKRFAFRQPGTRELALVMAAAALSGCGTLWTVGFFGATLSVKFPDAPAPKVYATVEIVPPATQGVKP